MIECDHINHDATEMVIDGFPYVFEIIDGVGAWVPKYTKQEMAVFKIRLQPFFQSKAKKGVGNDSRRRSKNSNHTPKSKH